MALFGSHKGNMQDQGALLERDLSELGERLIILENSAREIGMQVETRDETLESNKSHIHTELLSLRLHYKSVSRELHSLVSSMKYLIIDIRKKAKNEDLERIQRISDRWAPETFVTRREIKHIAQKILSES